MAQMLPTILPLASRTQWPTRWEGDGEGASAPAVCAATGVAPRVTITAVAARKSRRLRIVWSFSILPPISRTVSDPKVLGAEVDRTLSVRKRRDRDTSHAVKYELAVILGSFRVILFEVSSHALSAWLGPVRPLPCAARRWPC